MVIVLSMGLGIFFMLLTIAFMNGMNRQMVENTINTSLGHIAIHARGFQKSMELTTCFIPSGRIEAELSGSAGIKSYAPRVKVQAMVQSAQASRGVLVVGIDPEKEKEVSSIYEYTLKDGNSRFLSGPGDKGILISRTLAKKLDLLAGDKLVLMLQDKNNDIQAAGMTVTGLYESPVDSFDKFVVFTGIDTIRKISGIGRNISELTIIVRDRKNVDKVKRGLLNDLKDDSLEILSWKDMAPNLVSAVALFDSMMYIFFMIIFITIVFSIANTLIMAIMERFHEIGVMKSIGTRPLWIFSLVMLEAVNLSLVGLAFGLLAGIMFSVITGYTGINLGFYMESMRTWGTGSVIYPYIRLQDIMVSLLIVIVTAFLAALFPAIKAARINALKALHYI